MIESGMGSDYFLTYDEAWLFCITCTHFKKYDWRMMTRREFIEYKPREKWFVKSTHVPHLKIAQVLPVRDVND